MMLRELIGRVLRRTRLAQRRTLREVADAVGMSIGHLSEVERGRKEPSSEMLAAICRALGISMTDLLAAVLHDLQPRLHRFEVAAQERSAAGRVRARRMDFELAA
jgi:transcriptional regulator with XRE-family HTH domain